VPSRARRTALKGALSVVLGILLLLITLALQPSIGSAAATAIFLGGLALILLVDRFA
jgi:hypothetical protein